MQQPTPLSVPASFCRRAKPTMKLHDRYNGNGFIGSTVFAKKKLQDMEPIFSKTDIWTKLFTLVNLHFNGAVNVEKDLLGFARAEIEDKEGIYQVSEYGYFTRIDKQPNGQESKTNVFRVVVRLQPGEANKNKGLYFNSFNASFEFEQQGEDVLFSLETEYTRSANLIWSWIQDRMMVNIKIVMEEALKQCMNTAWTRVCDPEAYKLKEFMGQKKIVRDVSSGCDLFLMSTPPAAEGQNKGYIESDKRHLYLYKNEDHFVYFYDGKPYFIKENVKDALKKAEFNQPSNNPTRCEVKEISTTVLKITSDRAHTLSSPPGYDYGIRASWPVSASPKEVSQFLSNANNYKDLHERFTNQNINQVCLTFLRTPLFFDLTVENSKIILTAKKGVLAISGAQFVFDLKAKGNETEVTVDFNYSMGWFMGMFAGTVKQLAGKLITTILRHIAMGFAPAPVPTSTFESVKDSIAQMAV